MSPSGSGQQAPCMGDTPEQKRKHTRCPVPWDLSSWLALPPGSRHAGRPAHLGQHSVAPCPTGHPKLRRSLSSSSSSSRPGLLVSWPFSGVRDSRQLTLVTQPWQAGGPQGPESSNRLRQQPVSPEPGE